MLELTPNAKQHLRAARARRDDDRDPKLVRRAGNVMLGFALSPAPGDAVVRDSGMDVFVSKDLAPRLDAAILDAQVRDGKRVLVLRRKDGLGWEEG